MVNVLARVSAENSALVHGAPTAPVGASRPGSSLAQDTGPSSATTPTLTRTVAAPPAATPLAAGLTAPGTSADALSHLVELARLQAASSSTHGELRVTLERAATVVLLERRRLAPKLQRTDADGHAARARLTTLDRMVSALAPAARELGNDGARAMTKIARAAFGPSVLVTSVGTSELVLWSERDREAPARVCGLPSTLDVRAAVAAASPLRAPPALGHHPEDHVELRSSPALAHLGAARPGTGLGVPVGDLFLDERSPFVRAPDPTALLQATHAANAQADVANGTELRIVSYNVALLLYELFGFYDHKRSPLLEQRRGPLAQALFTQGDDVVSVQELWRTEDVELFARLAAEHGYRTFVGPRSHFNDGLATFVKEALIAPGTEPSHRTRAYAAQDWKEWWAAELTSLGLDVGVERGYHELRFEHPQAGPVVVFNTHMQAFPEAWRGRMAQARELGLAARAHGAGPAVLLTGDMNSGPYYPSDTRGGDGEQTRGWWNNSVAYPLLQHYSRARDLVVAGRGAAEADADVRAPDGGPGNEPRYPFTASHRSNTLYARQYGGREFEARLDHVLGLAPGRLKVLSSELAYTGDVVLPSGQVSELSDHYGVRVRLRLGQLLSQGGGTR